MGFFSSFMNRRGTGWLRMLSLRNPQRYQDILTINRHALLIEPSNSHRRFVRCLKWSRSIAHQACPSNTSRCSCPACWTIGLPTVRVQKQQLGFTHITPGFYPALANRLKTNSSTGHHIKWDLRYTQKPLHLASFFKQYSVLFPMTPRTTKNWHVCVLLTVNVRSSMTKRSA